MRYYSGLTKESADAFSYFDFVIGENIEIGKSITEYKVVR
jgi:hypothetical protein